MGSQVPTLQKLTSVQKNTLAQHVWKAPPRPRGQPCSRLCGGGPLCGEEADYSQQQSPHLLRRALLSARSFPHHRRGDPRDYRRRRRYAHYPRPSLHFPPCRGRRSYEEDNSWSSWLGLSSMTGVMRNMYNSLDIVETGFRYMNIEDESCRLKTICELESYAVSHPLASLAINTINSNLRGLDRYQTAIQAGINGEDCALIYDQCRVSYVGY